MILRFTTLALAYILSVCAAEAQQKTLTYQGKIYKVYPYRTFYDAFTSVSNFELNEPEIPYYPQNLQDGDYCVLFMKRAFPDTFLNPYTDKYPAILFSIKNGLKEGEARFLLTNYTKEVNFPVYYKGNYKNGVKDGRWVYYYYNSHALAVDSGYMYYKNGVKEGPFKGYIGNQRFASGYYKNGLKNGVFIDSGQRTLQKYYYRNDTQLNVNETINHRFAHASYGINSYGYNTKYLKVKYSLSPYLRHEEISPENDSLTILLKEIDNAFPNIHITGKVKESIIKKLDDSSKFYVNEEGAGYAIPFHEQLELFEFAVGSDANYSFLGESYRRNNQYKLGYVNYTKITSGLKVKNIPFMKIVYTSKNGNSKYINYMINNNIRVKNYTDSFVINSHFENSELHAAGILKLLKDFDYNEYKMLKYLKKKQVSIVEANQFVREDSILGRIFNYTVRFNKALVFNLLYSVNGYSLTKIKVDVVDAELLKKVAKGSLSFSLENYKHIQFPVIQLQNGSIPNVFQSFVNKYGNQEFYIFANGQYHRFWVSTWERDKIKNLTGKDFYYENAKGDSFFLQNLVYVPSSKKHPVQMVFRLGFVKSIQIPFFYQNEPYLFSENYNNFKTEYPLINSNTEYFWFFTNNNGLKDYFSKVTPYINFITSIAPLVYVNDTLMKQGRVIISTKDERSWRLIPHDTLVIIKNKDLKDFYFRRMDIRFKDNVNSQIDVDYTFNESSKFLYKNGKLDGPVRYWPEYNLTAVETYKEGLQHLRSTTSGSIFNIEGADEYGENQIVNSIDFDKGIRHGSAYQQWGDDYSGRFNFKADTLDGPFEINYNKKLIEKGNFVNKKLHGTNYVYYIVDSLNAPRIKDRIDYNMGSLLKYTHYSLNGHPNIEYLGDSSMNSNLPHDYYISTELRTRSFWNFQRYILSYEINNYLNNMFFLNPYENFYSSEISGLVKTFYSNGRPCSEGKIFKGHRTGEWNFYNLSGKLYKTIDYSPGNFIRNNSTDSQNHLGFVKSYYPNGKPFYQGYILKFNEQTNCNTQIMLSYEDVYYTTYLDSNGNSMLQYNHPFRIADYNIEGAKIYDGWWNNGNRDSLWLFYANNGSLIRRGIYRMGLEHGLWMQGDLEGIRSLDNMCFLSLADLLKSGKLNELTFDETLYNRGVLVYNHQTYVNTTGFSNNPTKKYFYYRNFKYTGAANSNTIVWDGY